MSLYSAYTLTIQSDFPLPELPTVEAAADTVAEIRILEGKVPETLPDADHRGVLHETQGNAVLYRVPAGVRFLIEDGHTITFERAPGLDDASVRAFLLTVALGALLYERGEIVMQGGAVEIDGAAALILGESGVGKSTIIAGLIQRGARLIADDFTGVRLNADGQAVVTPGYPSMRLWRFSLQKLDCAPHDYEHLPIVRPTIYKYIVPMRDKFAAQPLPIKRIYILERMFEQTPYLTPIAPMVAFTALSSFLYLQRLALDLNVMKRHWSLMSSLAQQPIQIARRTHQVFEIAQIVDLLLGDFRA